MDTCSIVSKPCFTFNVTLPYSILPSATKAPGEKALDRTRFNERWKAYHEIIELKNDLLEREVPHAGKEHKNIHGIKISWRVSSGCSAWQDPSHKITPLGWFNLVEIKLGIKTCKKSVCSALHIRAGKWKKKKEGKKRDRKIQSSRAYKKENGL